MAKVVSENYGTAWIVFLRMTGQRSGPLASANYKALTPFERERLVKIGRAERLAICLDRSFVSLATNKCKALVLGRRRGFERHHEREGVIERPELDALN